MKAFGRRDRRTKTNELRPLCIALSDGVFTIGGVAALGDGT